jgi:SnoaL-like domain
MTDSEIELGTISSPGALVETMSAEREIYETYLNYFLCLDTKMPCERAGECFTENTEITYHMKGQPMTFHGRSNYVAFLKTATAAQEMTAHVVGQRLIRWSHGKPRLLTYVTVWQWFVSKKSLGKDRPADFVTIGHSEDDFECAHGKWLISRRVVKPVAGLVAAGALPDFGSG